MPIKIRRELVKEMTERKIHRTKKQSCRIEHRGVIYMAYLIQEQGDKWLVGFKSKNVLELGNGEKIGEVWI